MVEKATNATITIVFDNNAYDSELKTGWGFSCLVSLDEKEILFDTGSDSPGLISNMEKLKIDPKKIDIVVLSHIHGDHAGGLFGLLEIAHSIVVCAPQSFPESFKDRIRVYGAKLVNVSEQMQIFDSVYTTGELGTWIKEQSLVVKTDKGVVVITGCAHPGIVNIVEWAKEFTKDDVYLILGGFHLGDASNDEIKSVVASFRSLGVAKVAPCHCTGDRAIKAFKTEYKDNFIEAGVGKKIAV